MGYLHASITAVTAYRKSIWDSIPVQYHLTRTIHYKIQWPLAIRLLPWSSNWSQKCI